MQALCNGMNVIDLGNTYNYGFYENERYKWAVTGTDGAVLFYVVDPMATAQTAEECVFYVAEIPDEEYPEDYVHGKYLFEDGHLVENPDWTEPVIPLSDVELTEKIKQQEAEISTLSDYSADMLYMICLMQLGITEDDLEGGEDDGL